MINFRFHLVSLIAVFLALAAGIVIGSQVVDQAIVETLRDQIDSARERSNDIERENEELQSELDHRERELEELAPFTADGRLTGVPVSVLALRGTDEDDVDRLVELLRTADARLPATLWLEDAWELSDPDDEQRLQEVIGSTLTGAALQRRALAELAQRLGTTTTPERQTGRPGTTSAPPAADDDLLRALVDAGFLSVDLGGGFDDADMAAWPGPGSRAVIATGTDAFGADADFERVVAESLVAAGLPVAVGEAWRDHEDGPARGARVAGVRDDDVLRARVSTVDTLDLSSGAVTAALALQDLGRGVVAHYGYGDGADRAVPAWTE